MSSYFSLSLSLSLSLCGTGLASHLSSFLPSPFPYESDAKAARSKQFDLLYLRLWGRWEIVLLANYAGNKKTTATLCVVIEHIDGST